MEQFLVKFDNTLLKLEKESCWETASDVIFQQWKDTPADLNYLLCAGMQLWYTLLEMDYIRNAPMLADNIEWVSEQQLQNNLMEVTRYGFKYFGDNAIFNAYFGYMISVMPYFFIDYKGDYDGWKAKGIEMMRRSHSLSPNNPFTRAMLFESDGCGKDTPFYHACKEIWQEITPEQWGNSAVQQYFFHILKGDLFYPDAYSE